MSTSSPDADRNLVFGLLALQMDFITREQLVDAMSDWMTRTAKSLGQVLHERGLMSERRTLLLEDLVTEHTEQHGSTRASLAAIRVEPSVWQELDRLDETELKVNLSMIATRIGDADPLATRPNSRQASCARSAPGTAGDVLASPRFRRLRPHAKGGLGEVFVALDEELRREVALKEILEKHADNADVRSRFLREAQITGNLEHPGIVPVYGLGCHSDGRPYYAMRFIRGQSMKEAISRFHRADQMMGRDPTERSLALRDLLGRFVAVCRAVDYAHSRGVIHRDLKPSNIMLGEYGETLVVDWGLARPLAVPQSERPGEEGPLSVALSGDSLPTLMGQVVGTPGFLSPEQAEGRLDLVGPASDVYALGGTLYCLLTGQPPHAGTEGLQGSPHGEHKPARQQKRSVPRPLEAVCARAMADRPEDRYRTARMIAEDVERWLADEPVEAYRERLPERLRRWSRRNRTLVSASVVLLLAVVVGLAAGLWAVEREQAHTVRALTNAEQNLERALEAEAQAKANLKQAEANLKLARQAVDECFNVARDHPLFQSPRLKEAKKLLLEKTLPFYRRFRSQRPDDRGLQQEEAEQLYRVAYIEQTLGHSSDALKAYRQARVLAARLVHDHPDVPRYQRDLAHMHNNMGVMLSSQGKRDEALKEHRQALDIREKLVREHPSTPQYQNDLASSHNNLGNLLYALHDGAAAEKHYRQACDIRVKLVGAHPRVSEYQNDLASTYSNLGNLLKAIGKRAEALEEYQRAYNIQMALVRVQANTFAYREGLVRTCLNRGALLATMDQLSAGLDAFNEGVTHTNTLSRLDPGSLQVRSFFVFALPRRAALLMRLGRPRDADADWDLVLKLAPAAQRAGLRLGRAASWARSGDYQRASAEAGELARDSLPPEALYNLACIHALDAASAFGDASRPLPERHKSAEQYARAAVALLRQLAAGGHFSQPATVAHLDRDDDLDFVRGREDYKRFRAGLKPAN
jgi:serine/threonine-protein kinase